jgi:hypothetical protein
MGRERLEWFRRNVAELEDELKAKDLQTELGNDDGK